jgi:hypothetical protein
MRLIAKLKAFEAKLLAACGPHIKCSKGCSACCILESVFPVEAWNIYSTIISGGYSVRAPGRVRGRCVFLSGGECSIYECRPVICRTHGYPVMAEGRVDFCPENFKGLSSIDSGFILDLEPLNRALVSINRMFLDENRDEFFTPERIMLEDLKVRIVEVS